MHFESKSIRPLPRRAYHGACPLSTDAPTRPKSEATRVAPLALWRVAEAFLSTLHMLFGAPEEVAAKHTLTAKAHALMASWLRCAEAMLRRLVAIEAAAYGAPPPSPDGDTSPARGGGQRARKLVVHEPEHPENWRV